MTKLFKGRFQGHKLAIFLLGTMLLPLFASAQLDRVEPPHWWVGMNNSQLQLLVKGEGISTYIPRVQGEGLSIRKATPGDSPNYLFIDLDTRDAESGTYLFSLQKNGAEDVEFEYELKEREMEAEEFVGFNSSDVIYLITPDRFANGDPSNDKSDGMRETKVNRDKDYSRHGGDIKGIMDHLEYLENMGFTAIWSNPLLENDMPKQSYHGYAITDYYKVDPRFGTNETYIQLAEMMRDRGMKLVVDGVVNHCGAEHWWMKDMPFDDWVNYPKTKTNTNHRRTVNQDPYAADIDKEQMNQGWFVSAMPDLNQRNPFMATYLIQNSIWWIETLKLGGIRQDTYPYPDKDFLSEWTCRIMDEYPNFSMVGEEWTTNPLLVSYWQEGSGLADGYRSCLSSTMDFPMQTNLKQALTEEEGWGSGLVKLYEGLANDFAYAEPMDLMVFADNHDMDRIHTQMGKDPALTKMAMAYILTVRGIPQVYYGTEILMENSEKPGDHGLIRTDFPGGWSGDQTNAFEEVGLKEEEQDMQRYMQRILEWRKENEVIHRGRTKHFAPQDGMYVYFRYLGEEMVMVVLNKNEEAVELSLQRFSEILPEGRVGRNIQTDQSYNLEESIAVPGKTAIILDVE